MTITEQPLESRPFSSIHKHDNHPPLSPVKINKHSNLIIWLIPTPFPMWSRAQTVFLPGYGTLPFVTSSVSRIPKDHTSDFIVNLPYNAASGAVHLIGNFAPNERISLNQNRDRVKVLVHRWLLCFATHAGGQHCREVLTNSSMEYSQRGQVGGTCRAEVKT